VILIDCLRFGGSQLIEAILPLKYKRTSKTLDKQNNCSIIQADVPFTGWRLE
jgi:hypothetical protein